MNLVLPIYIWPIFDLLSDTLGTPEGPERAVRYFGDACEKVLENLRDAGPGPEKTFHYIYTAHPDKHMHHLGVEHESVGACVRGIDAHVEKLCKGLEAEIWRKHGKKCALLLTADHGHVTSAGLGRELVEFPQEIADRFLVYCNVGATGKGRHAYFHVKIEWYIKLFLGVHFAANWVSVH